MLHCLEFVYFDSSDWEAKMVSLAIDKDLDTLENFWKKHQENFVGSIMSTNFGFMLLEPLVELHIFWCNNFYISSSRLSQIFEVEHNLSIQKRLGAHSYLTVSE